MKKIIYLVIALLMINILSAQNKKLTLYYPDSTKIVNIAGLDSLVIFICSASQVHYGGKAYNTVLIGEQCWLKENLDVGTRINGDSNASNNGVIEKYCYDDDTANCTTYGGLYQWNEAMQYITDEGTQGICPSGWHIPTLAEFQTLAVTVGNDVNTLKAIGQGSDGGAGTNTSGFSGLLAGYWDRNGYFLYLGNYADFWISTEIINTGNAYYLYLYYNYTNSLFGPNGYYKETGFSVRCVKD